MEKKIFDDKNGLGYTLYGDYYIPDVIAAEEKEKIRIGVWGMYRKNYLVQNNRVLFNIMLADGTLWNHLAETDKQAEEMFSRLVDEIAQTEEVTEELKVTDQMAWVGAMNNIGQRATEIVNDEIIYR